MVHITTVHLLILGIEAILQILKKLTLKLIRQIFNMQGNLLTQNEGILRCNNMVFQFVVKCILLVVVLIVGSVQTCYTYLNSWFIVVCTVHQQHAHHLFKKISIVDRVRWVVKVLTWGTKLAIFCQITNVLHCISLYILN